MKTIYQASNAVEAHMLQHYLQQEGIPCRVDGEFLQGAAGDLPATGLVRLVADESDYDRARTAITRWEAASIVESGPPAPAAVAQSKTRTLIVAALAACVGAASVYALYRAPISTDGIDHNRDGVLDEKWTFSPNKTLLKTEVDRNLDGKVDYIVRHDAQGIPETAESDDDFNGTFESRYRFRRGNLELVETDTDADGYPDLRTLYEFGVVQSTKYVNPKTGQPMRIEYYRLGKMTTAEVDTDADGKLDTRITYSPLAEVTKTEKIAP